MQQNPAVIVDVTPALKIEEDIEPTAAQPVVVKPEDVEMPEAPKGYQKLDVSEDAFARLLPGGTRKKRSRKKAQSRSRRWNPRRPRSRRRYTWFGSSSR